MEKAHRMLHAANRPEGEDRAEHAPAILDSLDARIAVIDGAGAILEVN